MAYQQVEFHQRNRVALHVAFRIARWMRWAKNPELILDAMNSDGSGDSDTPTVQVEFKKWSGQKTHHSILIAFRGNKGTIATWEGDSDPFECSFTVYPQLSGEPRVSIKGLLKKTHAQR